MHEWVPFWRGLNDEQKADYLDKWNASEAWRSSVDVRFNATDEELEEEGRASYARRLEERARRREEEMRRTPALIRMIKRWYFGYDGRWND
ncbi:hypothetical protein LOC54_01005 [Acetobacter sp. AN02]|uniref:hypothetical protein n=1 Tax=Acetobacter sp. AN02 TaxID=2894186 RepID=UPI0024341A73|nr:hypothetical protein [Acetobacter sp. AN02]MDG6093702.1 hypothetical protein [Acetobacter sp. AN02]